MISDLESIDGHQLITLSFLRIVLMISPSNRQNGFYTAVVFSDPDYSYTDRIIQIITSESKVPTKIFTFKDGYHLKAARQYEQPSDINIFAFPRANFLKQFQSIQHSLFYSDRRLFLIMSSDETSQEVLDSIRLNISGLKSFLIFRPNGELWLYRVLHSMSENIARYQVDLTKPDSVLETMRSVANWRKQDLPFWNPIFFVHYYPPFNLNAANFKKDGTYVATELIGPDPLMAYDIANRLNATGRIVTDMNSVSRCYICKPGEKSRKGAYGDNPLVSLHYQRIVLHRPPLNYNYSSPMADFYMTSKSMRVPSPSDPPYYPVDCYPHGFDCLCIVVPRSKHHEVFLKRLVGHQFTWAVLMTLFAFIFFRFCITDEPWSRAIMVTIALFLVQRFQNIKMKPSQQLWTLFMLIFGFFSITILSTMLFASLVNNPAVAEIDTLEQLAASGLTVLVNDKAHEDTWDFSNTPIANQVRYVATTDLDKALLGRVNTSNAYVIKASRALWSLSITDYATRHEGSLFRIMKYHLTCNPIAYKLPSDSLYRDPVNFIVQTIKEAGIFAIRFKWTIDFLKSLYPPNHEVIKTTVINLDVLLGVFYLYLIGILVSSCAFVAEITWIWWKKRSRKNTKKGTK